MSKSETPLDATRRLMARATEAVREREKTAAAEELGYNVFDVMALSTDEVNCHCRILHDLLNPQGAHGQGSLFLRRFFEEVARMDVPRSSLASARVSRERVFEGGRIDVLIECPPACCIVVEVKIYAGDQSGQLLRYKSFLDNWRDGNSPNAKGRIYYLTLHGDYASNASTGGDDSIYERISFRDDIIPWLRRCLASLAESMPPEARNESLASVIKQYVQLLERLTGDAKMDEFANAVANEIGSTRESYLAAKQIEDALPLAKTRLLKRVFSDMEEFLADELETPPLRAPRSSNDVNLYYVRSERRKPWPRLIFPLRQQKGCTIALTVELDRRLYIGLTYFAISEPRESNGEGFRRIDGKAYRARALGQGVIWQSMIDRAPDDDWWLHWTYVEGKEDIRLHASATPEDGRDSINFKDCSNGYEKLFDPAEYDEWMKRAKARLHAYVKQVEALGFDTETTASA